MPLWALNAPAPVTKILPDPDVRATTAASPAVTEASAVMDTLPFCVIAWIAFDPGLLIVPSPLVVIVILSAPKTYPHAEVDGAVTTVLMSAARAACGGAITAPAPRIVPTSKARRSPARFANVRTKADSRASKPVAE